MSTDKLADIPTQFQSNQILYRLAEALGYNKRVGDIETGYIIDADPDAVLEEALEIIWRYQDMADS